jgi:hypothetical protein
MDAKSNNPGGVMSGSAPKGQVGKNYIVKQGECISSIARNHGLFWQTLWNHPNNAALKTKRKDPNILYPGDIIYIPGKTEKQESGDTEKRHRFFKKGEPAKIHLQILFNDRPRAKERYVLTIDGQHFSGQTDTQGRIKQPIPPNAKEGKLIVGEDEEQTEYVLQLGNMDPIDEITGTQGRLNNLGFTCGEVNGIFGPETKAALARFQEDYGLPVTGQIDPVTQAKLQQVHGS